MRLGVIVLCGVRSRRLCDQTIQPRGFAPPRTVQFWGSRHSANVRIVGPLSSRHVNEMNFGSSAVLINRLNPCLLYLRIGRASGGQAELRSVTGLTFQGCNNQVIELHEAHLTTATACRTMASGIVSPSDWADLILTLISTLVAFSTGSSAGLALFKILSTRPAARR